MALPPITPGMVASAAPTLMSSVGPEATKSLTASGPALTDAAIKLIPGPLEKQMMQEYESIRALTAGGGGGLTTSQEDALRGAAEARTARTKRGLWQQLNRGKDVLGGEGGQKWEAYRTLGREAEGEEAQEKSRIRESSLNLAVKFREFASRLRAQLMAKKAADAEGAIAAWNRVQGVPTGSPEADREAAELQREQLTATGEAWRDYRAGQSAQAEANAKEALLEQEAEALAAQQALGSEA